MPTPISLPKGFKRLDPFPLDDDAYFTSLSALQAYANGATSYAGQVCAVVADGQVTLYKINSDKSLSAMATQAEAVAFSIALG